MGRSWMGGAVMVTVLAASSSADDGSSHVLVGELVRVNLTRSWIGVKVAGPPPREIEVATGPETVMSSGGRPLRLADLRNGERIVVACDDSGGAHRARRIKMGGKQR